MSYILESYDNTLHQILEKGCRKSNRTGIDTLSISGIQCRYDISDRFPILTKRKVWPKSIFAELLWFLSGSTNNKDLQALGSNIWTPWVSTEFEKTHGYVEGALGPVYGFQLRHFGGRYGNGAPIQFEVYESSEGYQYKKEFSYGEGGFDQLQNMIDLLHNDPDSRRNLFSLWNPRDLSKMRIPPCHYTFQVFAHNNKLSGMLTQRSCDMFIGCAANIQFYSAFIYILSQQIGYRPHEFIHSIGDAHIYINHIEATNKYLSRESKESPKLLLNKASDIYSYNLEDFKVINYNPHDPIKVAVAV